MTEFCFNAAIFDLDGVITQTAFVHSKAWKKIFDEYLRYREEKYGEKFYEFTHIDDYLVYVDGKPRYKGVESFLQSRGIKISYGDPSDTPGKETVCGLGNKKNLIFNEIMAQDGVFVYETSVILIEKLRNNGIKVGVASSSKNCKSIIEAAGLSDLFETRVDGVVSAELGLKGKPEPDIFTTACDNLGVSYDKAIIVEDAVSGVQAGLNGHFGLVLGVSRENNERELKNNGADIVVKDLGEITLDDMEEWFVKGLEKSNWSLCYYDYSYEKEKTRESLCTVGNGYFGTRGAMEECEANSVNYPGTYIAGVYNRLESQIAGRIIENEDFVNCPNWLAITFKLGNEEWFDFYNLEIVNCTRKLDFKTGIFSRRVTVKDEKGRETIIESSRLASMANPHIGAIRYRITPQNYSERITIKSGLDGNLVNAGVERYKPLNSKHLEPVIQEGKNDTSYLLVQTNQSRIKIAEAAKLIISKNDALVVPKIQVYKFKGAVYSLFDVNMKEKETIVVDKLVALYTSNDKNTEDPLEVAVGEITRITDYDTVVNNSVKSWLAIWNKIDIRIEGDRLIQKLIRLHLYHLLITASSHNANIDASIPARGLHGEAYRGHVFWDTLFILPFYSIHLPDVARSVLLYRYRRMEKAKEYARKHGYEGAMFPWQSGSDGREETPTVHLNPRSGKWDADHSSLQRHVSLAVAYNIWNYYWITNDLKFVEEYGAEIFLEICRFWASKSVLNEKNGRYEIKKVMGPDEYHEKHPGAEEAGLKDNFYTNVMVVWVFDRVFEILDKINSDMRTEIFRRIKLTDKEITKWKKIKKRINLVISDEGIFSQYDGYFDLKELNWEYYRKNYRNIGRMDRILKAEGKTPDEFKVAKQADVLMTFYNLHPQEVKIILERLGYPVKKDFLRANYDYYLNRTSHGSTLSRVVHSYLAHFFDLELSYRLYMEALESDYTDIQDGTTGEGIHTGVMAGTVLLTLYSYAGLDLRGDKVSVNPCLPKTWRKMTFGIKFRNDIYNFEITADTVKIKVTSAVNRIIRVIVDKNEISLNNDKWKIVKIQSESQVLQII
ncbi:MAG: HAD-IA family hydrolase [Candidatus Odinarchaeota archaeon]